jgi:DNA-binding LacI/PurR family transcriptional regulator
MPKENPTIYDVAQQAGVSISTVSRVLNTPDKVNESTRETVLAVIDHLGFVPKAEARARALKDTRRIGVITPFFTAPSFVQRLRGVASAIQESNYELVIYTVNSAERLRSYLERLPVTQSVDGLIILSLQFSNHFAKRLVDYGLETVLVEYPHSVLNSVEIDDIAGGKMAANFLIEKGHTNLGFVGDTDIPEFGIHPITQRLSGFRQSISKAGYELHPGNILLAPYSVETTYTKALHYLTKPDRPTAVFAATDLQAISLLKAARELGLHVPNDLAVLGFDDLDVAEYVGLSTINQHLDESGRIAGELLLSRLNDATRPVQHIQLPLVIIERETT